MGEGFPAATGCTKAAMAALLGAALDVRSGRTGMSPGPAPRTDETLFVYDARDTDFSEISPKRDENWRETEQPPVRSSGERTAPRHSLHPGGPLMRLNVASLRRLVKGTRHVEFVRQDLTSYSAWSRSAGIWGMLRALK